MTRFILVLLGLAGASLAPGSDLVVDAGFEGMPGTSVSGTRTFSSIAQALAQIPAANARPVTIRVRDGRYDEKLVVETPHVRLYGQSRQGTVITHGDTGDTAGPDGERLGTDGSYTLRVSAPDFRAENLSIENHFDYAANAARAGDDPLKVHNAQAVALMLGEGSDRAVFENVTIRGSQDTLFVDAGRSYFHRARISGHVDFIFGAGQAVFEDCEIVSRHRPNKNPSGYITAPSTPAEMPYGFLFLDCRLLKESAQVPAGSVRLGRPWHPGADPGVNGSAVFVNCYMDDHVGPEGYAPISARNAAGERVWFETGPESRFFEFGSHGPGTVLSPKRLVLSERAAQWYKPEYVLDGWRPEP
jgi:pectinesterase